MPSIYGSLNDGQALVTILIQPLIDSADAFSTEQFTALIDTGATKTCITRTAVELLGLQPFTRLLVATPNGLERRKAYAFNIGFLDEGDGSIGAPRAPYIFPTPVTGADFIKNSNFDVLIGMDIITKGRLVIEQQRFELTFN